MSDNLNAPIPAGGHPDDDQTIRAGVWAVMREEGYADGEILDAENTRCQDAGCEFDYNSSRWDCFNEDGDSNHPKKDRLQEIYETVRVAIEAMEPLILAAHPADTETEWGVMRVDDGTVIILSSRETACELILSDECIVSRLVTPWEVSK